MTYVVLNPTQHIQDLCIPKTTKWLVGEIEDDTEKRRDLLHSWVRRLNIGKITSPQIDIQV